MKDYKRATPLDRQGQIASLTLSLTMTTGAILVLIGSSPARLIKAIHSEVECRWLVWLILSDLFLWLTFLRKADRTAVSRNQLKSH